MQQINLYSYLPKTIRSVITLKVLTALYGIFFAVLMLNYFIGCLMKNHETTQTNTAKQVLNFERNHLIDLSLKYPSSSITPLLFQSNQTAACQVKFSAYLEAFAESIVPGVWLTEIHISANGKEIDLKGHALKAAFAQQFVEHLKKQPIFLSLDFELQELTQFSELMSEQNTVNHYVNFDLSTKAVTPHA